MKLLTLALLSTIFGVVMLCIQEYRGSKRCEQFTGCPATMHARWIRSLCVCAVVEP